MRRLALFIALVGCSKSSDGPTPVVSSAIPDPVCIAQAAQTVITVAGTGFSPIVTGGLTTPAVVMPQVFLVAASGTQTEVPPADVSLPDATGTVLVVSVPTGLVPPGVYGVEVVDPDGHGTTLAAGLTIDAPPDLISVSPTFGDVGQTVTVTLTGTGFRQGMTVTLAATPPVPGTAVTVSADGTTAMATFDLTGVAAGVYDITVDNHDGCTSTLAMAFTVRTTEFTLTGIDPPFGCMCSTTNVTISSAGSFVSTPRVEMRPAGQATPVTLMTRVAFVDANTITAVVPSGLALGLYDITVVNPPSDGRAGLLPNGFRVVAMPIPTIEQVVPDRAPPSTSVNLDIYGSNFRSPIKVEFLDRTITVVATATATSVVSSSHATATITTPATADAYLVRVTDNDEMTYSTWSAFIVGAEGASGKLHSFTASTTLVTGRRMLGGVSARDDLNNAFVYAIDGDTGGATQTVLATVEVAQLSKFGALAAWRQEKASNNTTVARDAPAAVAVPLRDTTDPCPAPLICIPPLKTYVYVLGGRDAAGAVVGSVERAVVLRNGDAPVLAIAASATAGTLAAGTWYYKVSAIVNDPDNMGGETLPSDEAILTISGAQTAIDLSWAAVANATGYRVYRTAMVNGVSQQELLIASPSGTSYTDTGATAGTEAPLPPGSLGVWTAQTATPLTQIRWGHQAAVITDNNGGTGGRSLYVLGGKSDATTSSSYLTSVELSPIDSAGNLGTFATTNATVLATGLAFFSLVVETAQNVSGFTGVARLFTCGGVTSAGASSELTQSDITGGGGNGAWSAYAGAGNLGIRGGDMAVISSNKLFALGGAGSATATTPTFTNIAMGGTNVAFTASGAISTPIQSTANAFPAGNPRALGAPIIGSGFIYFVGGTSDGTDAVATTFQTF